MYAEAGDNEEQCHSSASMTHDLGESPEPEGTVADLGLNLIVAHGVVEHDRESCRAAETIYREQPRILHNASVPGEQSAAVGFP